MKFSYNLLRQLSGTKKTAEELAELIMFHSFEVESVEPFAHGLEGVVVGRVESVESHPDADRLRVTTVATEEGGLVRTIVCGAPNVAAGQKVAVALPGAKLPAGIEIKEAVIRGVASSGMICAEDELGIGTGHEEILILPEDAPVGTPFATYVGLEDMILDVNILPNRGCDAVSYRGMAREIAALEGRSATFDLESAPFPSYPESSVPVSIESDRCRRYLGIAFEGVTPGSSPLWLRSVLLRSGFRPISLAVDITNYSLLVFGQPMHAFDAETLEGGIVVRQAKDGEMLELLDGKTVSLSVEDLVIADANRPLALAGVMGGSHSGITEHTKRVFLEVATFDPASIRKSVTRHRLPTDASYRYERNVDTDRATAAAVEVVNLFAVEAGANVIGATDIATCLDEPVSVSFSPSVFRDMFGVNIDLADAKKKLGYLGMVVTESAEKWNVLVPAYRPDLRDGWDFAEEVGRMLGYDYFPATTPLVPLRAPEKNDAGIFARKLREFLTASGLDEIRTYSFYSESDGKRLGPGMANRHLRLANPMNPNQALLRASLLPTSLRKAGENIRYFDSFGFFEIGDRYLVGEEGRSIENGMLSIVLVTKKGEDAFAVLKGLISKLSVFAGLGEIIWESIPFERAVEEFPLLHPTRVGLLSVNGKALGEAGEISPSAIAAYDLRGVVVSAQIDFDVLRSAYGTVRTFVPLPRFPYSVRDLSIKVPKRTTIGDIEGMMRNSSPLLRKVEVFDIFEKGDTKNVAFHLAFGHDDRTVTGEETESAIEVVLESVRMGFGAERAS
ncbi:MAG: phenylalanine--tRNA ligase subunit beta, partial [Candidatus Moranbacteria bacterium]|nr:phenylalanine--tRNA ligase subunit beta [Candidatus Moranbacteria bacterium]